MHGPAKPQSVAWAPSWTWLFKNEFTLIENGSDLIYLTYVPAGQAAKRSLGPAQDLERWARETPSKDPVNSACAELLPHQP